MIYRSFFLVKDFDQMQVIKGWGTQWIQSVWFWSSLHPINTILKAYLMDLMAVND